MDEKEKKDKLVNKIIVIAAKIVLIIVIIVINNALISANAGYRNEMPVSGVSGLVTSGGRYHNNGELYNLLGNDKTLTVAVISIFTFVLTCLINVDLIKKVNWKILIPIAIVLLVLIFVYNNALFDASISIVC